jgi:uncharacterized membrane protein YfcA
MEPFSAEAHLDGVVAVPLLLALGVPPRFATASMNAAIVGNSAADTVYNSARQRVSWALGLWMGLGSAAGGLTGSWLVSRIDSPRALDTGISLGFLAVLALALVLMVRRGHTDTEGPPHRWMTALPFRLHSALNAQPVSPLLPMAAAFHIAILGAFLGIGGALLLSPLLIGMCHSSLRRTIPVVQLTILVGSFAAGSGHVFLTGNLDPGVAVLLIVGGSIGTPLGSRLKHRLSDPALSRLYAAVILVSMMKVAAGLFRTGQAASPPVATPLPAGEAWIVWACTLGFALVWGPASAWCFRPRADSST